MIHWRRCLVLAGFFILTACGHTPSLTATDVSILWEKGRAVGIAIPVSRLDLDSNDSLSRIVQVKLSTASEGPAIGGEYAVRRGQFTFHPLIPLTRGLDYAIWVRGRTVARIAIPKDTVIPRLTGIFPNEDTLPENLLKIHLVFSQPMAGGASLSYVRLLDQRGDTLPEIFLDLSPELWNEAGTELTLWLQPGRIKRGLIPNTLLGPPLIKGQHYQLVVLSAWKDQAGNTLPRTYTRHFIARTRDILSPAPDQWKLSIPKRNTQEPLRIDFGEPLDYEGLKQGIRIADSAGNAISGSWQVDERQTGGRFIPSNPWKTGRYQLLVEGRLEDLAGNNLNRLFDVDLKATHGRRSERETFEKAWKID